MVKERDKILLHTLWENQKDLTASFFKQITLEHGFINKQEYHLQDNLPLLAAVPTYIKCKLVAIMEKGNHPLILPEVKNAVVQKTFVPLELRLTGCNYGG